MNHHVDICFVCKNPFDDYFVKKHNEHIIQNAIGGFLTDDNILCEKCGCILNTEIDVEFNKTMQLFIVLSDIRIERNQNAIREFDINHNDKKLTVNKKLYVTPAVPEHRINHDNKKVVIYTNNKKTFNSYCKKDEIEQLKQDGYSIAMNSDITDLVSLPGETIIKNKFIEISDDINVKKGLVKIATEFALHKNIDPYLLTDLVTDNYMQDNVVIQYFPISLEEKIYEICKYEHEEHYPMHQLVLFNVKNNLYCYVELFSTIQKYVHLSGSYYDRDIIERYNRTSWNFNKDDWIPRRMKDLMIDCQQFNIDMYNKSIEKIQSELLNTIRLQKYIINDDYIIEKEKSLMEDYYQYLCISEYNKDYKVLDFMRRKINTNIDGIRIPTMKLDISGLKYMLRFLEKDFKYFRLKYNDIPIPDICRKISRKFKSKFINLRCTEYTNYCKCL